MRIQNVMKATVFFPYAGLDEKHGRDLKGGEFSDDVEASRFFNKLLQSDWKAGKISVDIGDSDAAVLGAKVVDAVRMATKPLVLDKVVPMPIQAVDEIPLAPLPPVSEEKAPTKTADNSVKVIDVPPPTIVKQPTQDVAKEIKAIGSVSLADLNKKAKQANASDVLARAAMAVNDTSVSGFKNEIPPQASGPGVPVMDKPKKATMEEIGKHMGGLV